MDKRKLGSQYEEQAADFLKKQGYRIAERNYRDRSGEIDIIGWDGGCLAFIEVKYRRDAAKGRSLEAVGCQKQRRISQAALSYRMKKRISEETPCRFDVVGIDRDEITLVKNAFDFSYGRAW